MVKKTFLSNQTRVLMIFVFNFILLSSCMGLTSDLTNTPSVRSVDNRLWQKNSFFLEGEFGAGHLVTVGFGYRWDRLSLGISAGFDTGSFEILDEKFNDYLVSASGVLGFQLFNRNKFWIDGYTKLGGEFYFVSPYSTSGFMVQPGIKAGFSGFFADLAMPLVFGLNKTVYFVQVGVGYRLGNLGSSAQKLPMPRADKKITFSSNQLTAQLIEKKISHAEESIIVRDFQQAQSEIDEILKLDTKNTKVLYLLGRLNYEKGDYRSALEICDKILALDGNFTNAGTMKTLIVQKIEQSEPVWIKEEKYYKASELLFDSFQEDSAIPKFMTSDGKFNIVSEETQKFGHWNITAEKGTNVLSTAIRLPDMSQFNGMTLSLRGEGIDILTIVFVVQNTRTEQLWEVPVTGITAGWKRLKIPFHYFQLPAELQSSMDLGKITQIRFITGNKQGWIDMDDILFFKEE
jgi:tetratricopeptide (TPR) repeat protein